MARDYGVEVEEGGVIGYHKSLLTHNDLFRIKQKVLDKLTSTFIFVQNKSHENLHGG